MKKERDQAKKKKEEEEERTRLWSEELVFEYSNGTCGICLAGHADTAIKHCNHVVCYQCALSLWERENPLCPYCRGFVDFVSDIKAGDITFNPAADNQPAGVV